MLLASCCGNSVSAQGTRDVQGKALYGLFFYSASIRTWVAFKTLLKRFFFKFRVINIYVADLRTCYGHCCVK